MAASSIARAGVEQGGWPSEVFEPGEEAKAEGLELACAVCCLVMREPTSLGCSNDHCLCRTCGKQLAQNSQSAGTQLKCPIDREAVAQERFRPAPFVSRRINELKAHCRFRGRGCEWRGDLGAFAAHSERCPAGWGVCGCCAERVLIDELPAHEEACRRPCPNAERGCAARLSVSDREAHLGACLQKLVAGFAFENRALKRRVEDLSEQLRTVRRRADAEAPAGQPVGASSGPAAAASSSSATADGAQAADAGQGPGELRVAPGQSIIAAVRRALPGQTILLAPGVYNEWVLLDKEVHIVGPREAVLDWDDGPTLLCTRAAAPSVRGITMRGQWAILISDGSRAVVEDCDISGTAAGIVASGEGTAPTLRGNTVHDCGSAGVVFRAQAEGVAEGNDVHGNGGAGIAIIDIADPVVRGNRIHDQTHGIRVFKHGRGTIEGNTFERISALSYAPGGVKVTDGCAPVVRGNTFQA